MFKSNIHHKTRQSPLKKLEILAANTTLSGNLFQKFMTRLSEIISLSLAKSDTKHRNVLYAMLTATLAAINRHLRSHDSLHKLNTV